MKEANYKYDLEQAKLNGTPLFSPPKLEDEPNPLDSFGENVNGLVSIAFKFDARDLLIESSIGGSSKPQI